MRTLQPLELYAGFLFLILPFAYFEVTQDPEITIRLLLMTLFSGLFMISFLLKRNKVFIDAQSEIPVISFAMFFLIGLFSVTKSINTGDGIMEAGKTGTWFVVFILLLGLLKLYPGNKFKLPLLITGSSLIFLSAGIIQFMNAIEEVKSGQLNTNVVAFLSNKNFFGETLLLILPFSVFLLLSQNKLIKILSVISIVLSIIFLIFIQSIAVFVALVFSLIIVSVLLLIFTRKLPEPAFSIKQKIIITIVIFVLVSLPFLLISTGKINTAPLISKYEAANFYINNPDQIFNIKTGKNDNSFYDRAFLIKNSLKIISEDPVFGCGISNWKILLPMYGMYGTEFMSVGRIRFEHPHNDYIFILSETGLIGLFLWVSVLISAIYYALKSIKKSVNRNEIFLLIFMIANIISFSVLSLFSYPKERIFSMLLLLSSIAIIISLNKNEIKFVKFKTGIFLKSSILFCGVFSIALLIHYKSEISLYKAFQFQKQGRFGLMQRSVESAMSPLHILDATGTPLSWHLGQSYYYQNNQQKAFENYLIASKQNPYHMQVLNDLGALYEAKGDHTNAVKYFNRVFAINPDFQDSKYNMVAVYFNSGETEKAYNLLLNLKGRYTEKWKSNLQTILFAKTEKLVQTSHDTLLVDIINGKIKNSPYFLLQQFDYSEKAGITFEQQLIKLKGSK